jgi:hypothetical protein
MNIFLDDIRVPSMSHNEIKGLGTNYSNSKNWVISRDYFDFCKLIDNHFNDIELISFDHDLACYLDGVEYTGKDAMEYLINYCVDNDKSLPNWYVHSDNTIGRDNIIKLALGYMKNIEKIDISSFRYYNKGFVNGRFI